MIKAEKYEAITVPPSQGSKSLESERRREVESWHGEEHKNTLSSSGTKASIIASGGGECGTLKDRRGGDVFENELCDPVALVENNVMGRVVK